MSVRENIASNIASTISGITSPSIKKVTRQPFDIDELSDKQYPAVIVQTSEETREDIEMGDGAKTRQGTIDFVISGFVKATLTLFLPVFFTDLLGVNAPNILPE